MNELNYLKVNLNLSFEALWHRISLINTSEYFNKVLNIDEQHTMLYNIKNTELKLKKLR